jgi:hypothetical protein
MQNTTSATNPTYTSLPCNVQSVYYTAANVYVTSSSVPGYSIGPWQANPNSPVNKNYISKFTLTPGENLGTKTYTGLGPIGMWSNGVAIFNAKDGRYYNNANGGWTNGITQNGWNRNAYYWEGLSFDACLGHPAPDGAYHHHVSPVCLYSPSNTTQHSGILGYAWDGYPIYGPYAYTNTDGTGPIKRMVSSYVLSTATTRTAGPAVSTSFPAGCFCEDFVFTAGAGDLDKYNGRNCKTPEYPNGTYAYFVTIDNNGKPAYPFTIGPQYFGTAVVSTNNVIPGGATQYLSGTLPVELFNFSVQLKNSDAGLVWFTGTEFQLFQYEIERSEDATHFYSIGFVSASGKNRYEYTDKKLSQGNHYYRIKSKDISGAAKYSSVVALNVTANSNLILHNNPAGDVLTIQHNDALYERTVILYDMNGREVKRAIMQQGMTMISLDVQTLYSGTYLLSVSGDGNKQVSKFIIAR